MSGTLFVVATPIGNLEDITLRALRVLRDVAVIAAEDTRRTAHLLARHGIATPTTSLHQHNERRKSPSVIQRLLAGDNVALVSDAGTPTVSDPGAHLIQLAMDAGIKVEPVPGPSAVTAALSVSGLSAETFTFLGFPPTRAKDRKAWFDRLSTASGTRIFFEAPHRIHRTLEELRRSLGDIDITLTRELTKTHEQLVKGPISKVLGRLVNGRGEFVVMYAGGQSTNIDHASDTAAPNLIPEFGELTAIDGSSKRKAVSVVAKRHGLSANQVYKALENAKKSVE